jgi:hypothetical protein
MASKQEFVELLAAARAGDQDAAARLVQSYEGQIRRVVRIRLTDPHLRRQLDSVDICQSVLGDFFRRAADGQFELATPQQLTALLVKMAKNRLLQYVESQQAARRDIRRLLQSSIDELSLAGDNETPSQIVASQELSQWLRARLDPETLWIAEQRLAGRRWADLAREKQTTPDGLRMRWTRALERVAEELKIAGIADG